MQYAKFRSKSSHYMPKQTVRKAYGVPVNAMRRLNIKPELKTGRYVNTTVDYRQKEHLEELEAIRHPRERDFYQDHSYHNQWIKRDLELNQKKTLTSRYSFFAKDFQKTPWLWHPGDTVEIVQGEHTGQRGTIIAVVAYKNQLIVQNVNVQDVVIPASESRPEQNVQREHPISVDIVRHVDPSTNEPCNVRLVTVRNKTTGALEEKRMSLTSGVLLPIPPRDDLMELGDPLKDTPILDADEQTYDPAKEMPLLVERKLQAMETYFVGRLKKAFEYHDQLSAKNEADMRAFQRDVVEGSVESLADMVVQGALRSVDEFLAEEVSEAVTDLQTTEAEEARAAAEKAAAAAAAASATRGGSKVDEDEDDEGEGDGDGEKGDDLSSASTSPEGEGPESHGDGSR